MNINRYRQKCLKFTIAVLMAISFTQANILGIDLGSNYIKATLVQPGKTFQIVENSASKRKTETMITFGNEQRDYGADSFIASGKFPETTFSELHRNFGEQFDAEVMSKFKEQRFITNNLVSDERGHVAWKISRMEDGEQVQEILYSEEIIGMILQYVKMLAEKQAGGFVRDCVITVPSWFTYDQRLMLKDAAEGLANLNVLQLTHENLAAATMFGID
jgi:hypoxia up-regulated 1